MRKIIQIAACGHDNTQATQSNLSLFALCDDGRLYCLNGASFIWNEVPLPNNALEVEVDGVVRGRYRNVGVLAEHFADTIKRCDEFQRELRDRDSRD